ncbi:MAG: hypothetical protein H7122_20985 [Chitinophagaceae bacterium]|nr:hypothetical protein [Chitinophagaceae bacterium]
MKKIQAILFAITCLYFLSACTEDQEKKVLVMASGKVQIKDNIITLDPGTTHTENEIKVTDGKLTVTSPAGSTDFSVTEPGIYILNIKNDTIVGSYQRIGTDNSQEVISQENLKTRIDSLKQLMAGSNANATNRNFSIPPNQITKISANTNAQIIGPYKKVPGSFEGGKEHEIYKFYTNKEMQEIVDKLGKMVE